MKTILIVIGTYLPGRLAGGPIRTTSNMIAWLGDDYRFLVLTADRDFSTQTPYEGVEPGVWYPVGKAQVRYLAAHERSLPALAQIIRDTAHDLLYLDSVLATLSIQYLLLRRLRLVPRKPVILVPRGNLGSGAIQINSSKKRVFFALARLTGLYAGLRWHASSADEGQRIQHVLHVRPSAIHAISNLPSPMLVHSTQETATRPPKEAGHVHMLTLSRIARKKNIHFLLEALRAVTHHITYDLYGPIEDVDYWHKCEQIIAGLPQNVQVRYQGEVPFERVTDVLAGYHLFALPTLNENFGHVILEALCAGCALLISDQTPWRGLQAQGVGWDLPLEQQGFRAALQAFTALDEAQFQQMSAAAYALGRAYVLNNDNIQQTKQLFDDATIQRTKQKA